MGEILNESHIFTGNQEREVEGRTNELIIVHDCHEEEGYGVYVAVPWSTTDGCTTSFGYGPMAEIMAAEFFKAVSNFYTNLLGKLPEETDLSENMPDDSEFDDDWIQVVHKRFDDGDLTNEMDSEASHQKGFRDMLSFIRKWSVA